MGNTLAEPSSMVCMYAQCELDISISVDTSEISVCQLPNIVICPPCKTMHVALHSKEADNDTAPHHWHATATCATLCAYVRLRGVVRLTKTYKLVTKVRSSNVFLACLVSHQISCFMPSYCYASQAGIDAGPDPCCMRRGKWVDVALIVSFVPSLGSEDIYSSCRCLKVGKEFKGGGVYLQPK